MDASGSGIVHSEKENEEEKLFHPPRDLICPITQNLFLDPVVNSVGQIYERQAFLSYLETSNDKIDPVTRQPIDENVLTSIYAVKARASEYREETAKRCVELATQSDIREAVKYLKRAAELCSEADIYVPGLGRDTVARISRQSKNAGYATVILLSFAEDLMKDRQREKAASVYYTLLKSGDRGLTQRPDLLRSCIECWAGRFVEGRDERISLEKLLEFVENQQAFSWGEIIEIMHHSNIDEHLILRLCEALLTKDDSDPALWKMQKDVMMKYIQIRCDRLQHTQGIADKDIRQLQEWKERAVRSGNLKPKTGISLATLKERRKPFFLKKRFIASLIIGVIELFDRGSPLARISKTLGILYLVNFH